MRVSGFYKYLLNLSGHANRQVIWVTDLVLSAFAFLTACLLVFEFNLAPHVRPIVMALALLLALRIAFQFWFKTHALIIRFIGEKDLRLVFFAVLGASLAFLLLVQVWPGFFPVRRFKAIALVDFLLVLTLMGGFRVLLRMVHDRLSRNGKGAQVRLNTLIYGAGELGAMTERVLRNNQNHPYKVVAFVDDDPALKGKQLNGIRIHSGRDLSELLGQLDIRVAVIGVNQLPEARRVSFINASLYAGVRVLKIPASESWINGDLQLGELKDINYEDLLNRPPIQLDVELIAEAVRGRILLVTGCAGSIGSELVRQILPYQPKMIIGLDNAESPLADFALSLEREVPFFPVIGSVTDEGRVDWILKTYGPAMVFHAAAYKHVPVMEAWPEEAIKTNIDGTRILAEASSRHGVEKFVMISTDKAVNPGNVMGASKRIAEMYVQALNSRPGNRTRFITTRFGNVLGSNGSVVPIFRQHIERREPLNVTHPDVTRYFMTIPEACQLVLEAGVSSQGGEILVFDMGEPVKILDLAHRMIRLAGLIPGQDIPIHFTGLRPGEKLHEELFDKDEQLKPTQNPKIMRAAVRARTFPEIQEPIEQLIAMAEQAGPAELLVKRMQTLVPEFHPWENGGSAAEITRPRIR
jgi:FlaA1/EpsC-like NDP-sugar epimerase